MPRVSWILGVVLVAACGAVFADEPNGTESASTAAPAETRIPFSSRNIWNWQVIDNQTVLIQTNSRKWYKAKLLSACIDLPFAERVGFKSNADDSFDKFSSIEVRGRRCSLISLTETQAPAKKSKGKPPEPPKGTTDLSKP